MTYVDSLAQIEYGSTKQVYTLDRGIMEIVALPNGHVVLPVDLCRRMGIGEGTRFDIDVDAHKGIIVLKPISCESYSIVYKRETMKVEPPNRTRRYKVKAK